MKPKTAVGSKFQNAGLKTVKLLFVGLLGNPSDAVQLIVNAGRHTQNATIVTNSQRL